MKGPAEHAGALGGIRLFGSGSFVHLLQKWLDPATEVGRHADLREGLRLDEGADEDPLETDDAVLQTGDREAERTFAEPCRDDRAIKRVSRRDRRTEVQAQMDERRADV